MKFWDTLLAAPGALNMTGDDDPDEVIPIASCPVCGQTYDLELQRRPRNCYHPMRTGQRSNPDREDY